MLSGRYPPHREILLLRWVTAQDLQSWAGRLDAETRLPELVRRLVRAAVDSPQKVAFPSGESVQTGGWDGILLAYTGNDYVPNDASGWELSKRHQHEPSQHEPS